MEDVTAGSIQLELKYCERCGGLWLRPKGSELVFCAACARVMAGVLPVWERGLEKLKIANRTGAKDAFWSEGGNA